MAFLQLCSSLLYASPLFVFVLCFVVQWDSYWVVRGLLVSGMVETARTVVNNLLGLVEDYGFVPNGSRRYYLNRSQPPMLTLMVRAVYDVTVSGIIQRALSYGMRGCDSCL